MKKNDGFTLLEVIIAIAVLSIISVFILQMFMSSATLNARAKNADIAMTKAITEIESLKAYSSLSRYLMDNDNASGDSAMAEVNMYYDKDWNSIGTGTQTNARFHLKMSITTASTPHQDTENELYGTLYDINAEVSDLSVKDNNPILTSLQTKKYFSTPFEQGGGNHG